MGQQHVEIFAKHIGDTDIIARFRIRQLRVAVFVFSAVAKLRRVVIRRRGTTIVVC